MVSFNASMAQSITLHFLEYHCIVSVISESYILGREAGPALETRGGLLT